MAPSMIFMTLLLLDSSCCDLVFFLASVVKMLILEYAW